jgi:hypothetical protein
MYVGIYIFKIGALFVDITLFEGSTSAMLASGATSANVECDP